MNWKKYEKEIHKYFSYAYPGASIKYDVKVHGRYSKKKRQVDILIDDEVAGYPIKIAVDTKNFSINVDVKCVESFISMLEDIDVHQGLLLTNKGFSEAAINRAYYGPHKLELDIFNFDQLLKNQSQIAVPYSGNKALFLTAPFGWVIDNSRTNISLALLYQRGRSLQDAQKAHEWMYLTFWYKDEVVKNIDDLIAFQNEYMAHSYTNLKINIEIGPKRNDDLEAKIRIATAKEIPCKEITGFIDCGGYIAFFVLFTIEQLETKNCRKLSHLLKYSLPANITFNNSKVIEQALEKVNNIRDREEKSAIFRQVAIWYSEMGDDQHALNYRRLSQEEFEKNYLNIKPLISMELSAGNSERAINYSALLFRMDPTNPTVMQDILSIYHIGEFHDLYLKLIDLLKAEFSDNHEALGSIYFHHAIRLGELGNVNGTIDSMNSAKVEFIQVYDKTHYVFEQIEKYLFFQQSKSSDPE